ncbi:MAG: class I tRNA ligase family protein, partial [Candidatus Competibacteraceae bacterium]|nr:class I tRNA ligase family protein [Candidatus Competibacteraceae bacterium]
VLEALLRLIHPLMPFITEEIWQRVAPLAGRSGKTLMLQPYPRFESAKVDHQAEAEIEWLKGFLLGVRRIRAEMNIAPAKPLPVLLSGGDQADRKRLEANRGILTNLGRLESLGWLEPDTQAPESATALVGALKVLIPLEGLIDKEAELRRLGREIDRLRQDMERARAKLDNPSFIDRAPTAVVEKERIKIKDIQSAIQELEGQRSRMERL